MSLETPADVVRYLIEVYSSELKSKNLGRLFNALTANGICRAIDYFAYSETISPSDYSVLTSIIKKRIGSEYICVMPRYADNHSLVYAYQARISLLEEIIIEVTPVDEEEELGTFEKFNNVLY